ncbi:MAG: TRAP transporter substrate-binding protein DctP [Pseudomonadota bacterium]
MRHLAIVATLCAAVFALLVLPSTIRADKAEFVIKFGTVAPDGTPWADQLRSIKKRVESESKGRIKMKLFLGGTLGGEVEMVRALRRGRIQGWGGSTAALAEGASLDPLLVFELPFFFRSFEEADYIADKVVKDDFVTLLNKNGFVFGHWNENGWRNFGTTKPAHTLADLRTMKMRSQEAPTHLAMYQALGVQAESIPVPEVLGALKTSMVDGFDNTPLFSSATGWYEGIKHYTISRHIYQPAIIVYSKKFVDELPPDLQKILIGDPDKESVEARKNVRAMATPLMQNFKEAGITVYELTPAERKPFEDACAKVPDQFEKKIGKKLLDKVKAALAEIRKK